MGGSFLVTPHLGSLCDMCDHLVYNNTFVKRTINFIWLCSPKLRNALVSKPGVSLYLKQGPLRTILCSTVIISGSLFISY